MTGPRRQRRGEVIAVAIGIVVLAGAIAFLAFIAGVNYLEHEIFDNELPNCDREPVTLEWTQSDGLWRRSATFELLDVSQTVQVDLTLSPGGGFNVAGTTVYAIAAGESLPDETTVGTQPIRGTVVGHGVEAINEQVTLEAGRWQLAIRGGAAPAEVRWPC